jgi:hypothetical protein
MEIEIRDAKSPTAGHLQPPPVTQLRADFAVPAVTLFTPAIRGFFGDRRRTVYSAAGRKSCGCYTIVIVFGSVCYIESRGSAWTRGTVLQIGLRWHQAN